MRKAIILLSGGLDSSITLFLAKNMGFELYALSCVYGQKHEKEMAFASEQAKLAGVKEHRVVNVNIGQWGGSSLTDNDIEIKDGDITNADIPDTYVPARNLVFLSLAASYAESVGARDIFIGVSEVDYSGYVDCRESFIKQMEIAINMGTVCGAEQNDPITVNAPFLNKTKAQEIEIGQKLGVDFSKTWSCYKGEDSPCGVCDSCLLRAEAFEKAGVIDGLINLKRE